MKSLTVEFTNINDSHRISSVRCSEDDIKILTQITYGLKIDGCQNNICTLIFTTDALITIINTEYLKIKKENEMSEKDIIHEWLMMVC